MPWTGASFKKHNKGLTPRESGHAARIANAILRESGNEGMAIATANKMARRVDGGDLPPPVASRPTVGFLAGGTLGRADKVHTASPSGSYVLPADVVSAIGEGNSIAGAQKIQEMLGGGMVDGGASPQDLTPVALSDGEYVVAPEEVQKLGNGNLKRGHRILDDFVLKVRRKHIAKLKSLPAPVGAKKK